MICWGEVAALQLNAQLPCLCPPGEHLHFQADFASDYIWLLVDGGFMEAFQASACRELDQQVNFTFTPELISDCSAQAFHSMLSPKTKLVAMVHVSNMTGAILPAEQVAEAARKVGYMPGHLYHNLQQYSISWLPQATVPLALCL